MPHYETKRTLIAEPQETHSFLVQNLPSIKDVEVQDAGNPILVLRKRRITANRNKMNAAITFEGNTLKIGIDGLGNAHAPFASEILDLLPAGVIDDHGISEVIANMDKSAKFFASLEINNLIEDMRSGERVLFMTSGVANDRTCAIILTNQRVLLKDKGIMNHSTKEIDPRAVTSISTGKKLTGESVALTVSGSELEISTMPHGRGTEFAERLRVLRDEANAPTPAPAPTAVDGLGQLQKLAELHAAGVLTDEEFAAAKAKALGL